MLAQRTAANAVTDLSVARERRSQMQGAPQLVVGGPEKEEQPVPRYSDGQQVNDWITKGFMALMALGVSLLVSFGGWLVISVNQINTSTSVLQSEFTPFKHDMVELKGAVDGLRIRGEGWATKDSLSQTKDGFRDDLSKIREHLTNLEVRLTKIESSPPR